MLRFSRRVQGNICKGDAEEFVGECEGKCKGNTKEPSGNTKQNAKGIDEDLSLNTMQNRKELPRICRTIQSQICDPVEDLPAMALNQTCASIG